MVTRVGDLGEIRGNFGLLLGFNPSAPIGRKIPTPH